MRSRCIENSSREHSGLPESTRERVAKEMAFLSVQLHGPESSLFSCCSPLLDLQIYSFFILERPPINPITSYGLTCPWYFHLAYEETKNGMMRTVVSSQQIDRTATRVILPPTATPTLPTTKQLPHTTHNLSLIWLTASCLKGRGSWPQPP